MFQSIHILYAMEDYNTFANFLVYYLTQENKLSTLDKQCSGVHLKRF